MKPATFPQANKTFVGPEGSDILPLPAYNDQEQTITFWEFEEHELAEINKVKGVWLMVRAGVTTPPVWVQTKSPFFSSPEAFHLITYTNALNPAKPDIIVFNAADILGPKAIRVGGELYLRDLSKAPIAKPGYKPKPGSYYFRATQPGEEREAFGEDVALVFLAFDGFEGLIQIPKEPTKKGSDEFLGGH